MPCLIVSIIKRNAYSLAGIPFLLNEKFSGKSEFYVTDRHNSDRDSQIPERDSYVPNRESLIPKRENVIPNSFQAKFSVSSRLILRF
jgi:hypothetical protein